MSIIGGMLNLANTSRSVTSLGAAVVRDALTEYFTKVNADLGALTALFVDSGFVEKPQIYVMEDSSGYLQVFGANERPENIDTMQGYTLGFPLYSHGAAIGGNRITMAYMTVDDLDQKLQSVTNSATATVRRDILRALFGSTTATFNDQIFGNVSVFPLANGDSQTYVVAAGVPATDTHQLYPGYALASISTTNNPLVTLYDELVEHRGTGNVLYIAGTAACRALKTTFTADWIPVAETGVTYREDNTSSLGGVAVPGTLLGKFATYGWLTEWPYVPANYMLAVDMNASNRPLKMRVDPIETGLPRGLTLIAEDENFPFKNSYFDWRYGIGGYNRVGAAVLQFGTGGAYAVPTLY